MFGLKQATDFVRLHLVTLFSILFFESLSFSLFSPSVLLPVLFKLVSFINFLLELVSVNLVI